MEIVDWALQGLFGGSIFGGFSLLSLDFSTNDGNIIMNNLFNYTIKLSKKL